MSYSCIPDDVRACHRCGPVRHESPTVLCAPCALADAAEQEARATAAELLSGRVVFHDEAKIADRQWFRRVRELVKAGCGQ